MPRLPALGLLFFVSGFSALLLETIWARLLSFHFGHTVAAAGAAATSTLAGLAVGSRWGGRLADRLRRPLAAYALLEILIALWAIASPFWIRGIVRLDAWVPEALRGAGGSLPLLATAAASLLLPAAILMGATTPLVVRAAGVRERAPIGPARAASAGPALGRLYGWNTLGGAAGAAGAVLFLLPAAGLRGALHVAAGLGILVAAGAFLLARGREPAPERSPGPAGSEPVDDSEAQPGKAERGGRIPRSGVLLALFGAGLLGSAGQITTTRLIVLLFGSSAQAFGVALAAHLAGLAAGSAWCARRLAAGRDPVALAAGSALGAAGFALLSLPLWHLAPLWLPLAHVRAGADLTSSLFLQVLLSLASSLPAAAALGSMLPALAAQLRGGRDRFGRDAGDAYSIDTWGSVAGALLVPSLLLPALGAQGVLRGSAILAAILAGGLLAVGARTPRRGRALLAPVAAAAVAAAALALPRWDPVRMTSGPVLYARSYAAGGAAGFGEVERAIRRRGPLRFHEEGAEATVTVREAAGGTLSLQINGKTDASTGGDLPTQVLAGQLPALLHPGPRSALVIGLASGVTAGSIATHPVGSLDVVEISPAVTLAARLFSGAAREILDDPRTALILGDGRALLARSEGRYDLIASQPTNPWIAGVTNLFTREFFDLARSRLAPGGVLAVWVQAYAMHPGDFRGVAGTFLDAFPGAVLWEESAAGGDYFLLGCREGVWPDPGTLAARMAACAECRFDLRRAGVEEVADLLARFVAGPGGLARLARGAVPITDDNLRLEYSGPAALWTGPEADLLREVERVRESPFDVLGRPDFPGAEEVRRRMGEIERIRGERIRLALSLRRADLEALAVPAVAAALQAVRAGRPDTAIPLLREGLREATGSASIPLLLGWMLLDRGESEEAGAVFTLALARDPDSAEAFTGIGLAAWRRGDRGLAEVSFRRARELDPGDSGAANNLASVLLAAGRYAEALEILDALLAREPRHVPARINRGVALARTGRFEDAERDYRVALEQDPSNEDAGYNLKRLRERTGAR
jgi:Flp pilus assembly protein TadD